MELGYNTDISLEDGTYHVQTEGRLDSNPRVETLVYKSGAVLARLSNPDPELGSDDRRIEETKRKIRDQHLSVVALVRRNEFEKIADVVPAPTAYDFLHLIPSEVTGNWADVLTGRHEALFEEWKRALADAMGLATPNDLHGEFRSILGRFAAFLADASVELGNKQGLLSLLLRVDARFRIVDVYESFRRERGEVREYAELIAAMRATTDRLVDLLILQSSGESALATELLVDLFTRQSMELVKYLFEQAEKKLTGADAQNQEALPTVLLFLEEKVASENIPNKELDDIFDRLNYLYARLSVKTVREVSTRITKIREKRGVKTQLKAAQKKKANEYVEYLESCKQQIEGAWDLEQKLVRVNEFKTVIDGWDKALRLHINLRLAVKGYHNFVTVNILETAALVAIRLRKLLPSLPSEPRASAGAVLVELQESLDAKLNVRKVVVPAIEAQEILDGFATARLGASPPGDAEAARRVEPVPEDGAPSAPIPERRPEPTTVTIIEEGEGVPATTVESTSDVNDRIKAIEEKLKVGALQLLRAIEEITRALTKLDRLEEGGGLSDPQLKRIAKCRQEMALKKKVLSHKLSAL